MTAVIWFLAANTVVVAAALGLAAAAWVKVGGYMQTCRCTVQAYAHALEDTQPQRAVDDEDDMERTEEHDPVVDVEVLCCELHRPGFAGSCCDPDDCSPCCPDCPTYCPALGGAPGGLPKVADFAVFEQPTGRHARVEPTEVIPTVGELDSREPVPRYYFDELAKREALMCDDQRDYAEEQHNERLLRET